MRHRASLVVGLSLLCAGGCGTPSASKDEADFAVAIRDSAGVRIVSNAPTEPRGPTGDEGFDELLTIGVADGEPRYRFEDVTGIAVLADGGVAVLDRGPQVIRIYGPAGTFRRTVAGPGSGPGEISSQAFSVFAGRGDTLVVPDPGNSRVTVIPPTGESTSFPVPPERGLLMGADLSDDGTLALQWRGTAPPGSSRDAATDAIVTHAYDGTAIDTLLTPPRGGLFEMAGATPRFTVFAAEPRWTLLDDGWIAYGSSDSFRVRVHDSAGALRTVIELDASPPAVSRTEHALVREQVRKLLQRNGVPDRRILQMLDGLRIAERWPAFSRLLSGPDGSIWMQRVRHVDDMTQEERAEWNPLQTGRGDPEWLVFRSDGTYDATVIFPPRFHPIRIEQGHVWGVYRDELGIPYVRAYGIGEPG